MTADLRWSAGASMAGNCVDDPQERICNFLTFVGIPWTSETIDDSSFLPGVRIDAGGLRFDSRRLRWPGDLLHEAGHIAVTPSQRRASLHGALDGAEAAPHGGEVEAIAWSWAALVHLALPPELLFHPGGYRGQADSLKTAYLLGVYPGAYGLAQAGLALVGLEATNAGVKPYPHMLRWLRA